MKWIAGVRFEQYVDERAALKMLGAKPAVEDVEDGKEPLCRIRRALFDFVFEPIPRPHLFAPIEKGYRQFDF